MLQKLSDVQLSNISGGGRIKTNIESSHDISSSRHCIYCKRSLGRNEFCISIPYITAANGGSVQWLPSIKGFCSAICAKKYANEIPPIFELKTSEGNESLNLIKAPHTKYRIFKNFR